jgi:hypothetical protein
MAGTVVETGASASEVLTLPDGSSVRPDTSTRVEIVTAHSRSVHLVLARGAINLDVTHRTGRPFVVSASDVDINVRGTRFRVALGNGDARHDVTVSVAEGAVEVCRASVSSCRMIAAGETFSTGALRESTAPAKAPAKATDEAVVEAPAPASVPASLEVARKGKSRDSYATRGAGGLAEALATATPEALFELGDEARLAGAPRDAAMAFDRLRRRYRTDPRAGLAAFQLGRLRFDLGDAAGAAEALTDALALAKSAKNAPFREDAEARLAQAYEDVGPRALDRCQAARDAYLKDYPHGVHAATVARRCAPR